MCERGQSLTLVCKSREPKEPWKRATCITTADTLLERKDSSSLSQNGLLQLLSHHKNITIFDAYMIAWRNNTGTGGESKEEPVF